MSSQDQERERFLIWLGGYVDNGACLKTYYHRSVVRGRLYISLNCHIVVTGRKEVVEYIKSHYARWNASCLPRKTRTKKQMWNFSVRERTEALLFCEELLPYSKFRKDELTKVIHAIKSEVRKR